MTFEFIWGVITFSFGMAATPGPNNTIAFSSGLNYGIIRTVPFILGVSIGVPLMMAVIASGLGELLEAFPQFYTYIRYIGAGYILYLSWKVATAVPPAENQENGPRRHPTFSDGILSQWMNPKSWILVVTSLGVYLGKDVFSIKLIFLCTTFFIACVVSLSGWALGGVLSSRLIRSVRVYRAMNTAMGLLLASSVVTLF